MRILMLSEFYPPTIGGIEQHVRNLSMGLVARGHHVAVATLWQEGLPRFETDRGVAVHRIRGTLQRMGWIFRDKGRRHAPPFPDPQLVIELTRVLAREKPDIVHGHNWLARSFLPLKASSRLPLVITQHDYRRVCATHRFVYHGVACPGSGTRCLKCASSHYGLARGAPIVLANWAMARLEGAGVDMYLPVSQAVADGTRLAQDSLRFRVTANFVPDNVAEVQAGTSPEDELLPTEDYILFVGDVSPDKGADVLLRAHAQLSRQVALVLVGRRDASIPSDWGRNVRIIPGMPHDAVMRAWSRCILGVAPSVIPDACPTVVMEAMASGKPVVASRIGGMVDIVSNEETGLFVSPGDVDSLREAMERLIGDPGLRSRMGQAAKARVRRFQASQVIPLVEQVYEKVVKSAKRAT